MATWDLFVAFTTDSIETNEVCIYMQQSSGSCATRMRVHARTDRRVALEGWIPATNLASLAEKSASRLRLYARGCSAAI